MNQETLTLGFSPCPNDTFMFHGLLHGAVDTGCLGFAAELHDIEILNRRATNGPQLDVSKLSLPSLARTLSSYTILQAGAALGRGCGPLLVARDTTDAPQSLDDLASRTVAIPGRYTTANLLLQSFAPVTPTTTELRFDQIMPAVRQGKADAGVIIHESRFTFADHGLVQIADLGALWESATGLPLPLGIIAARRSLGTTRIRKVESALRQSVEAAFAEPLASQDYVRTHAQEMDHEVCRQHIELYVNQHSIDLGDAGRAAILEMLSRGRQADLLPDGPAPF